MFSQWVDYFYSAKKMYTARTIFLEYLYSTQNICTDRGIFVHCEEYFYSAADICTVYIESMSKQWRSIFKSCGNMWTERRIFVQCGEYSYPGEEKKNVNISAVSKLSTALQNVTKSRGYVFPEMWRAFLKWWIIFPIFSARARW